LEAHLKLEEDGVSISFLIITECPEIPIALSEDLANQMVAAMILVVTGANQDMAMTMSMGIINRVLSHPMITTTMGLIGIIRDEIEGPQVELFNSRWRPLSTETSLKLSFL
jgi:hypothetical protein